MVVLSMVAVASPAAIADEDDDHTETLETLQNGEDLYLAFGADLGDMSLEEYIEAHASDNPAGASTDAAGPGDAEVIQYQDVGQVNLVEEGEAVSVAIGGGQAIAIQEVDQQNLNDQEGYATAENHPTASHEATFEDVGDVYVVVGNNGDQSFDGWAIADDKGEVTASQTAIASVTQGQEVGQANIVQNATAFALAEDDSDAVAVQFTEQNNLNLQEGHASATNVLAADLDDKKDGHDKHKKKHDGDLNVDQTADATVEQVQEADQVNAFQEGAAVAIAIGENSTATAIQMTDQSNINEQLGTAEAVNVLMDSAGMNVATASIGSATPIVAQDAMAYDEPKEKNDDGEKKDGDVDQYAEASVLQYQSAEQANMLINSSATAVATNASTAQAIQLTYQQNVNAQVASADALNIFFEEDEIPKKHDDKTKDHDDKKNAHGVPEAGHSFETFVITETTALTLGGDELADADRTSFDYDGGSDQLNDVEQWSTAEVEQSQEIVQLNYEASNAIAVAEDGGSASAVQLTVQENENVQVGSAEAISHESGPIGDEEKKDEEKPDPKDDEEKKADSDDSVGSTQVSADEETEADDADDGMPGFGVAVALVALLSAAAFAIRSRP